MVEYEEYNEDLKFMYESRDLKFMIESASYKELEFAAKVLDFVWGAVKMELKGRSELEEELVDEVENQSEDENDKSGESLEKSKLQVNHEYQRRKL
tara:strand:- start:2873 stop:3160 length:288 start_codon:yes stop_codon:yes gene_type:complete